MVPGRLPPDNPGEWLKAAALTDYAVETRYPGAYEPVTRDEYEQAALLAEEVVRWAQQIVNPPPPDQP